MTTHAQRIEELRWQKFPVLDDGFVCLVDCMGDDSAIVQAARVSYGAGTKQVSDDRTLIRYLMRHRHTTPFEMAELKFLVRVPMDCWRQWIRHRTACLAGDSLLYFDLPGAESRGARQRFNKTIAEFHRLWHEGSHHGVPKKKPTHTNRIEAESTYTIPELARLVERREETLRNLIRDGKLVAERREINNSTQASLHVSGQAWIDYAETTYSVSTPLRDRLEKMQLRMCDERTGEIHHTTVTDVWATGVKPVFRVTLENGYQLKMTKDHLCLTEDGWQTLEQATRLRHLPSGMCSWDAASPAFAVNGVPVHQDREWLTQKRNSGLSVADIASEAGVSYHTIRKYLSAFELKFTGAEKGRLRSQALRGRKRNAPRRGPLQGAALENVRRARSGVNCNFSRGGTTPDRSAIGRWTTENAPRVHERCGFQCILCGAKKQLEAHHIDPVWHNRERADDLENLASLCRECHTAIRQGHLELDLLADVSGDADLATFWKRHPEPRSGPAQKRKPPVRKLKRTWSKVARIEYAGEEMTYDLSVAGPYHNFVANGFIVHNSVNEYSTRYSVAIDAAQTTAPDQWRTQSAVNRQGSGEMLPRDVGERLSAAEREFQQAAAALYNERLQAGVAREQARKDLPLCTYTEAYWKIDLHNLIHFLSLRMDEHAQWEIRQYATTIGEKIVRPLFPVVWEAFLDYRQAAVLLTRLDIDVIRRLTAQGAATGSAPPYSEDAFLAAQDPSWVDLKRCRERDECRSKLVQLGLVSP